MISGIFPFRLRRLIIVGIGRRIRGKMLWMRLILGCDGSSGGFFGGRGEWFGNIRCGLLAGLFEIIDKA